MIGAWWSRRGLRARLVLSAAIPFVLALVVATVALALVFAAGRVRDLDAQTQTAADSLTALVSTGQVPTALPLPAGSPLLAQVLSADGAVLAASASASRVVPLLDPEALHRHRVVTDEEGSYAGVPLRIRVAPSTLAGQPVEVVVAAPLGDVRRALHALKVVLVVVVPVLAILTTWLVYGVAGLALGPVERLRSAAQDLAAHPTSEAALPAAPGDDEIARLAGTLNGMLRSLRSLVAQQQAFVADAAHELRSPVSALRVQLDVARAHPQTVVLPELVEDLSSDVDRLVHLLDDLLALSREEAGARPVLVPLDLRDVAAADGPPAPVLGDPAALDRLVRNLISNAQRVATTVTRTCSSDGPWVLLDIDDDGPGIAPADRERVFDRWVRLDAARARQDGGSGLGLALAREIAHRHGGDLIVHDSPLGGARLRLRLPHA
jgi:signal transduction histidine kinase